MFSFLLRRLAPGLLFATLLSCLPGRLAAELVWSPQTGWQIEGGVLAGVGGSEGRNALELMNKARMAEERGSKGSALSSYGKVAKKYPNSVYAPEALYRSGMLRLARAQYHAAFSAFQQLVSRYPNTKRFNEVIGEQYRIASNLLDGKRAKIWGLIPGPTARSTSIGYFEVVLMNAPYSDYAPLCLMNIARAHQQRKETDEAIDALDRLINAYPQSLLTADAYFKLAQTHASLVAGPYYDQGSTKESVTYFEDFMILFPNDVNLGQAAKGLDGMKKMLAESKMKMADFYFYKRDNYLAARVFYNEAITAYPDSDVAKRAKVMLAKVEAKALGKPAPHEEPSSPKVKKKRFWLF
jgi:outer membrane protein assembly factor BamD